MKYVTSFERLGIEKGKQEAFLKGISLGLKLKFGSVGQNLMPEIESIQDVSLLETILMEIKTANTVEELRSIYHPTKSKQHMRYVTSFERIARMETLLKSIPICLRLKFGDEGESLLPEIENIEDFRLLEAILEAIETANTVSELRQIYQPTTGE